MRLENSENHKLVNGGLVSRLRHSESVRGGYEVSLPIEKN